MPQNLIPFSDGSLLWCVCASSFGCLPSGNNARCSSSSMRRRRRTCVRLSLLPSRRSRRGGGRRRRVRVRVDHRQKRMHVIRLLVCTNSETKCFALFCFPRLETRASLNSHDDDERERSARRRRRRPKVGFHVNLRFVCYNDYTSTAKELGYFHNQSINRRMPTKGREINRRSRDGEKRRAWLG